MEDKKKKLLKPESIYMCVCVLKIKNECSIIYRKLNAFEQARKVGRVARAIAIMSHPIPSTDESHSVQVILPQKQLGRRSDM
jgi:RAB protein geranylgeranyltransferase component A